MDERLLAHAFEVSELAKVDAVLHDAAFSLADLTFDEQRGVVGISFYDTPKMRDFASRREFRETDYGDRHLTISHVTSFGIDDPAQLVEHSYAQIDSPEAGRLTLKSNFPGHVDFRVSAIDVRVTA